MSLKSFHKFFIAVSILFCAFAAYWADGHNQQSVFSPWLLGAALLGLVVLTPYLAWRMKKV